MKKSRILAVIMLVSIFTGLMAFGNFSTNAATQESGPLSVNPEALGDTLEGQEVWAQMTTTAFTADGNLTEWTEEGIVGTPMGSTTIWVAYDATNVYVALQWTDATDDAAIGHWNKTGLIANTTDASWAFLDGADDVAAVGFDNGTAADVWVWTNSIRTAAGYAYECDASGVADGGNLPHIFNTNDTTLADNAKPLYMNDSSTTPDYLNDANGTRYQGWFADTPTGSQTDVAVGHNWTTTSHVLEFVRPLNTGQADDFVIDFTGDLNVWFGVGTADTRTMVVPISPYVIGTTNVAPALSFDAIVDDIPGTTEIDIQSSMLISGQVYDDYVFDLTVENSIGSTYTITEINEFTGNWSYLFQYNKDELPLGTANITVTLTPLYDAPISFVQEIVVDDVEAPEITAVSIVGADYNATTDEYTIPLDVDTVVVTAGLSDNYYSTNDLTAYLYYDNGDVVIPVVMEQFFVDSVTFSAEIPIIHDHNKTIIYDFFIQVWDLNLNKYESEHWEMISVPKNILNTVTTPGFGILVGLFGAAVAAFIIKKRK